LFSYLINSKSNYRLALHLKAFLRISKSLKEDSKVNFFFRISFWVVTGFGAQGDGTITLPFNGTDYVYNVKAALATRLGQSFIVAGMWSLAGICTAMRLLLRGRELHDEELLQEHVHPNDTVDLQLSLPGGGDDPDGKSSILTRRSLVL